VTDVETPPSGAGVIEERPMVGDPPAPPVVTDPTGDPPNGPPSSGPVYRADADDAEAAPFGRTTTLVLGAVVVVVLVVSLVLRFWTRSDLWLDEALTVNIARQPLGQIPSFLRRDGATPLFYFLLHFWMGWFGTSDLAVRSLPGVIGVITLPLTWLAGRRLGGRTVAWAALLLVATSPFAVRYDTETRMYSLIALLTVLAFLALDRSLRRPRVGNLVAVAVVTSLLLYSQYWALYLVGTTLLWLAFQSWRGRPEWRSGARASFVAVIVGCITFLPWVPTFLYQSRHTGTPWATPANFSAMVNAVATFAGGGTNQGRALGLIFFALAGLGLFGVAASRHHIDLDIRTRPLGRPVAIIVVGTLALAVAGGYISNSAFDARYASVVFIPLILLVSIGLVTFSDQRIRAIVLAVAVVAGLAGSFPNITTNRTQAGQVAAALAKHGRPGDLVAYCPDQLGPAVNRLLPGVRYRQTTFPRGSGPEFVNWVNYATASRDASPLRFTEKLESTAAKTGAQIFVVWATGYQTFGTKCEGIIQTLNADPSYTSRVLVELNVNEFYQPMYLSQFSPAPP
jgi:mannosyltransferase